MYLKQYSEVLLSYCRQGLQVLCIFLLVVPDVSEAVAVLGASRKVHRSEQAQANFCALLFTSGVFSPQAAALFPWITPHPAAHPSDPSLPRRKGHLRAVCANAAVIPLQR